MIVRSPCIFCGSACLLDYVVEDGNVKSVLPVSEDPVSEGHPCIKGLSIPELELRRVTQPMIRGQDGFEIVSWDYVLDYIKDRLESTDPCRTGWIGSGEITNEDNYAIQKFAREVVGSENIDTCARLCHAPTMRVYREMLGVPGTPHFENDVYSSDTVLLVGTNPYSTYPTIFSKILRSKAKILAVNIWENETTDSAHFKAIVRPGTMVFFVAGIVRDLIFKKGYSSDFEGFEAFKKSIKNFTEDVVCRVCDIRRSIFKEFVREIHESEKLAIQHGMKYTQTYHGTDAVRVLTGLALLKDARIITMRGKVNIQGAGDVGCFSEMSTLVDFLLLNPVDFVYCSVFNPARSMPALEEVWKNLKKMFFIHATPYFNATTEFSDVVLPTPLLYEREGTVTNGERLVRYVRRVVKPPGSAKQDWEILNELSLLMGDYFGYRCSKDVFREITSTVRDYSHINPDVVYSGDDVHARKTITKRVFSPVLLVYYEYPGYDYFLVTSRHITHFNTGDVTSCSRTLSKLQPRNKLYMNPDDAQAEGIAPGMLVRVVSPQSSLDLEVDVSRKIPKGVLVTTFHFEGSPVNILTPKVFDKEVRIPAYKAIPVRIEKV